MKRPCPEMVSSTRITISGQAPPILPIRDKMFQDNVMPCERVDAGPPTLRVLKASRLVEDCASARFHELDYTTCNALLTQPKSLIFCFVGIIQETIPQSKMIFGVRFYLASISSDKRLSIIDLE